MNRESEEKVEAQCRIGSPLAVWAYSNINYELVQGKPGQTTRFTKKEHFESRLLNIERASALQTESGRWLITEGSASHPTFGDTRNHK